MITFRHAKYLLWQTLGAVLILMLSCSTSGTSSGSKGDSASLRIEMHKVLSSAQELFTYAWDQGKFVDPKNEKDIRNTLQQLSGSFHRIEATGSNLGAEPGFRAGLIHQRNLLKEIEFHFIAGEKDYAASQLRSIAGNCVACHSRFQVPLDFIGTPPPVSTTNSASPQQQFAIAQYYFATRQFEKSITALERLILNPTRDIYNHGYPFRALKLWLVIEVRIKEDFANAASWLKNDLLKTLFTGHHLSSISAWQDDLLKLSRDSSAFFSANDMQIASAEVDRLVTLDSQTTDEIALVRTLRISAELHKYLLLPQTELGSRLATLLLAKSYVHLPIESLNALADLQLAQVIYQFPDTPEARQAFALYEKHQRQIFGREGDSIALSPADDYTLELLERLAFGLDSLEEDQ